jgi:Uncharacterized small protein (DUF2158)
MGTALILGSILLAALLLGIGGDAMERKIEAGDIVNLKSGGPDMTVTDIENNVATVLYFDVQEDSYALVSETIPVIALELFDENPED